MNNSRETPARRMHVSKKCTYQRLIDVESQDTCEAGHLSYYTMMASPPAIVRKFDQSVRYNSIQDGYSQLKKLFQCSRHCIPRLPAFGSHPLQSIHNTSTHCCGSQSYGYRIHIHGFGRGRCESIHRTRLTRHAHDLYALVRRSNIKVDPFLRINCV